MEAIQFIKDRIALPAEEAQRFSQLAVRKTLAKGEHFIREGNVPRKMAFVSDGLFRYYYIDKKGIELSKNFITQNNFIASYSAMIAEKPSAMFIEALEDSVICEIQYKDWIKLKQEHVCWKELLILFLEKAFVIKEKREREFLLLSATERYTIFKEEFPGLEHRIKQHHIASYLGISPVSLSRLKNALICTK